MHDQLSTLAALQIPSKPMAATATTALGALWVSMAAALIWATEFLGDNQTKLDPSTITSHACKSLSLHLETSRAHPEPQKDMQAFWSCNREICTTDLEDISENA